MLKKKTAKSSRKPSRRKRSEQYSWIAEDLRPLAVSIDRLKPDPKNARIHDQANLRAITASLREFGQLKPVVANRKTRIIEAGNAAFQAAKQLGWSQLAVVWVKHNAAAGRGFAIADNRTAELAGWDDALLAELLADIKNDTRDLYEQLLLDQLRRENEEDQDDIAGQCEDVPESYEVMIECRDEAEQKRVYQRMQKDGFKCRLLTL